MPVSGQRMKQRARDWRARAERVYTRHGRVFHIVWIGAGFVVLLGGLAMTVFPGPAVVVIPIGLAMLSLHFPGLAG